MTVPYSSELAAALAPDVLDRLLRYVRIDTQSDRAYTQSPSTPGQLELARLLVSELLEIGLADAAIDDLGFVTATLPGTVEGGTVIGLLAHVDTSPDAPGAGVEPLVVTMSCPSLVASSGIRSGSSSVSLRGSAITPPS